MYSHVHLYQIAHTFNCFEHSGPDEINVLIAHANFDIWSRYLDIIYNLSLESVLPFSYLFEMANKKLNLYLCV